MSIYFLFHMFCLTYNNMYFEKEKLTKKLIDERFPYYMNKYETMLSSSETGFFVGKEVCKYYAMNWLQN